MTSCCESENNNVKFNKFLHARPRLSWYHSDTLARLQSSSEKKSYVHVARMRQLSLEGGRGSHHFSEKKTIIQLPYVRIPLLINFNNLVIDLTYVKLCRNVAQKKSYVGMLFFCHHLGSDLCHMSKSS